MSPGGSTITEACPPAESFRSWRPWSAPLHHRRGATPDCPMLVDSRVHLKPATIGRTGDDKIPAVGAFGASPDRIAVPQRPPCRISRADPRHNRALAVRFSIHAEAPSSPRSSARIMDCSANLRRRPSPEGPFVSGPCDPRRCGEKPSLLFMHNYVNLFRLGPAIPSLPEPKRGPGGLPYFAAPHIY
jgi:hypothetical protein